MAFFIRTLSIADLDECHAVETAAFPPAEAATREKIEYRLTVTPEVSFGLFAEPGAGQLTAAPESIPVLLDGAAPKEGKLLAHTISTRSTSKVVKDQDMAIPENWQANPSAVYSVGHQAGGRTLALHSLAVSPATQRSGFGKALMKIYLEHFKRDGSADRVAILTYDRLVPYYEKLGFVDHGKSESEYAGIAWHDLTYKF